MTSLNDLYRDYGQSPWIDNIRRDWLNDGTLARLVDEGVRGVTSNPSIFAKALATSSAYDAAVAAAGDAEPEALFETLAVADVRDACDVLAGVHASSRDDFTAGRRRYLDGFVSLEVSPLLARDTAGTVAAAERLHARVGRPNVMIKIPATREGLPAIRAVLGRGINVNVTLIFSIERYHEVITAWAEDFATRSRRDSTSPRSRVWPRSSSRASTSRWTPCCPPGIPVAVPPPTHRPPLPTRCTASGCAARTSRLC